MWRASVLTIFPEMFPGPLAASLAGKALTSGLWSLDTHDIRNAATDKHRTVDDTPAGGGPGMVMKADVLAAALDTLPHDTRPRLLMSPRGTPLTQARAAELAAGPGVIIVCARFEGVDERLIKARALEEVSLGDFVLSGGEIAALALIDACVRLIPGVMGKEASAAEESFADGLLEYPQYTRPPLFEGESIPEVLTSGDHAKVAAWRRAKAERLTRERRPDLWAAYRKRLQQSPQHIAEQAVVLADESGVIRMWNAGAEALFGYPANMAVGRTLDLIVPEAYRERHWAGFRAAVASGRAQENDAAANIPVRHRDGSVVRHPGRLVFLRDAQDRAVGAMGIFLKDSPNSASLPDL